MALYGTGSNVNQTTDVSAGNYGSASAVPIITVDSDKRIDRNLISLSINTNDEIKNIKLNDWF